MTDEKILEIARRFTVPKEEGLTLVVFDKHGGTTPTGETLSMMMWSFCEEKLLAFAQSVIEEERDLTTIKVPTVIWDKLKDVNTVTDLIKALKAAETTND